MINSDASIVLLAAGAAMDAGSTLDDIRQLALDLGDGNSDIGRILAMFGVALFLVFEGHRRWSFPRYRSVARQADAKRGLLPNPAFDLNSLSDQRN